MRKMNYIRLVEVTSTNDYLKHYAKEMDDGQNTVVIAESQKSGRGAGKNTWESAAGKNLTFSILIHPVYIKPTEQFLISMAISNAVTKTVANLQWHQNAAMQCKVKWPNDVYIGKSKICGILIENTLNKEGIKYSIIGVGLNVNQTEFFSDAPNPGSLKHFLGHEVDREELLIHLLDEFERQMMTLAHGQEETVREEYVDNLFRKEGMHTYRDKDGEFEAEIVQIEDDGHLILRDDKGKLRRYGFKEVEFVIVR